MKISEHLIEMKKVVEKEGDLDIMFWPYCCTMPSDFEANHISIRSDLKDNKRIVLFGDD